jgi:hypothetical protein
MATISELMSEQARRRLLERLAELAETERLLAERGQQKPPPIPPALDDLAERERARLPHALP